MPAWAGRFIGTYSRLFNSRSCQLANGSCNRCDYSARSAPKTNAEPPFL